MKSFSLIRTNVGLTTNVKVVIDSSYNLFLESINSSPELDSSRFKKFQFNKNNFYDELVPYFFKDFPVDISFGIKYENDNSNMSTDFTNQYDDIYQMGARNISNNKNYDEEYEFLAPLYVFKHSLPTHFIIFRIDGPGLSPLTKDTFRAEFLLHLKAVKVFDLTRKTPIGEWIDRNFRNNKSFPNWCLEVDFRNLEFTKWTGIDYESGGFTFKSKFLDENLENENTLFDLEKFFFDGFQINKIIYPQIINFNFLFDDTPATPTSLRKWSLNRYCGFYINELELIGCITPFRMPTLKDDISILSGNILNANNEDPFLNGFNDNQVMWVEYNGNFYQVEKFKSTEENQLTQLNLGGNIQSDEYSDVITIKYRIISDLDLSGKENELNTNQCTISPDKTILYSTGETYSISSIEDGDINLIEIDGIYHSVILENGYIKLVTDYGFSTNPDYRFEYFINSPDPIYYKYIDISPTATPTSFKIYRAKLTEIKDFDTQILESEFAKFEYEKKDDITKTEEIKLYTTDLRSGSNPPTFNDYIYKGQVELIPCSSDYTSNLETFRISNNDLTDLWRKNPIHCRFGYQNSISSYDYPYLLNNNDVHGDFNRTTNTLKIIPERQSNNLDYFYTINSGTTSYLYHSLHIERNYGSIQDTSFRFELDKYLNLYTYSVGTMSLTYSNDYFEYLFGSEQEFLGGQLVTNTKKYSLFDVGDKSTPNTTLFRGLKFRIFEVDTIKVGIDSIDSINLFSSNQFQDYKFSILLSQNLQYVNSGGTISDTINWGYFSDNAYTGGTASFVTSNTTAPTNISIGDVVEIRQFYPFLYQEYEGLATVTAVGSVGFGGFGFEIDKTFVDNSPPNPGYYKVNTQWKVIKKWEHDVEYKSNEYILYDDVIYLVTSDNIIEDPQEDPSTSTSNYSLYTESQPFWNPGYTYSSNEWVYRQGDFYMRNTNTYSKSGDFWNISSTYSVDQIVIHNGRYYQNYIDQLSSVQPMQKSRSLDISSSNSYWIENPTFNTSISTSTYSSMWDLIPIWDDNEFYDLNDHIVHNDVLYKSFMDSNINNQPDTSSYWIRVYSFDPDNSYVYGTQSNQIIKMNDSFYLCSFNKDYKLNSEITIYINKKWKNILVNIAINDNTCFNIDNEERDILYNEINSRLTAANFISQINDLDSKYGFSKFTNYIIIEENGEVSKYDFENNIESLPYILICEPPDEFELKNNTLLYRSEVVDKNIIKPTKELKDGNVDNIQKINYYNDIPLACEITNSTSEVSSGINYNGSVNTEINKKSYVSPKGSSSTSATIYRHSGPYMPVFYDINLFESISDKEYELGSMHKYTTISYTQSTMANLTKFNESLSLFGVMKQRIISKINRKENILKLRNNDSIKSIYPMLDEFGYTVSDFFIFKSTWDFEYHLELNMPKNSLTFVNNINQSIYLNQIVQNISSS